MNCHERRAAALHATILKDTLDGRFPEALSRCQEALAAEPDNADIMSGVELARIATARNPGLDVVVTSGRALPEPLPAGAKFWSKPWAPLDILREAEFAQVRRAAH